MALDLIKEFHDLVFNDPGIGHWVLLRHYTDEHSEYWNESTHEAVGGPAYKYVDTFVRAYSMSSMSLLRSSLGLNNTTVGNVDMSIVVYFVEANVEVYANDNLFELDYENSKKPSTIVYESNADASKGEAKALKKYYIRRIEDMRADAGKIQYKMLFCEKDIK